MKWNTFIQNIRYIISSWVLTWKTVSMAIENELKFEGGVPSSKLKVPPKSCIPNSAKIKINRKRSNNKDMMDLIELSKEITRFRSEDQYLKWKCLSFFSIWIQIWYLVLKLILTFSTYTVTLNIRSSLKALNTDKPKEPAFGLKCDHITSKTLPEITMQSKRLKEAWKYTFGPKAHIRKNISKMNRPRKTYSVQSVKKEL